MKNIALNAMDRGRVTWRNGVAAVLLGSALLVPIAGLCEDNDVRTAGSVSFVSGGVDDESLDQLKSISRDFNLKLVFALKSGAFLSDVNVTIDDARGNPVLLTKSEGPWLLAKLPTGNYQIAATESGNTITRRIAVGSGKLSTVDFRWQYE